MLNSEYYYMNFYAYHNLHFISATLLTGYILAVYTLRGKTKQVPLSISNKTLSDCKKGNTPVKLILLHRKQFITKHLIPLAITGLRRFDIIIPLGRFKITCLTDFFTVNVIILMNRLY